MQQRFLFCWILILNFDLCLLTSKSWTLMARSRLKVRTRSGLSAGCRSNSWLGYITLVLVSVSAASPMRRENLSLVAFRPNRTKLDSCSEMAEAPQRPSRFFCHQCLADVSPCLPVNTREMHMARLKSHPVLILSVYVFESSLVFSCVS